MSTGTAVNVAPAMVKVRAQQRQALLARASSAVLVLLAERAGTHTRACREKEGESEGEQGQLAPYYDCSYR